MAANMLTPVPYQATELEDGASKADDTASRDHDVSRECVAVA
jgi:hypothetical protein